MWDHCAADRVDFFIANSKTVQERIKKYYRADSKIIYPPVDTEKFHINPSSEKNYYLAIGRLTTYKKFDIIVQAFNDLGLPIKIVGTGIEENKLKKTARKNIEFLGHIQDKELPQVYASAKALIFPQIEDFGITPLESMASGRPVIAYRMGGALETVMENKTGIFFEEQNALSLAQAVREFEKNHEKFSPQEIRKHAEKFSKENFKQKIINYLEDILDRRPR